MTYVLLQSASTYYICIVGIKKYIENFTRSELTKSQQLSETWTFNAKRARADYHILLLCSIYKKYLIRMFNIASMPN